MNFIRHWTVSYIKDKLFCLIWSIHQFPQFQNIYFLSIKLLYAGTYYIFQSVFYNTNILVIDYDSCYKYVFFEIYHMTDKSTSLLSCTVSLKISVLHSHLSSFNFNWNNLIDIQGFVFLTHFKPCKFDPL